MGLVEGGRTAILKKCIKDRDKRLLVICGIMGFIMLLLVVSLFFVAFYLDLHPRLPIVTITNTTVGVFNLVEGSTIEAFLAFLMQSNNRYGIPFNYRSTTLELHYKNQKIGTVDVPPFFNPPRTNVTFTASSANQSFTVPNDGDVVRQLQYDFQVNRVEVLLSGTLKARFRASKTVRRSPVAVPVSCTVIVQPVSLSATQNCKYFKN